MFARWFSTFNLFPLAFNPLCLQLIMLSVFHVQYLKLILYFNSNSLSHFLWIYPKKNISHVSSCFFMCSHILYMHRNTSVFLSLNPVYAGHFHCGTKTTSHPLSECELQRMQGPFLFLFLAKSKLPGSIQSDHYLLAVRSAGGASSFLSKIWLPKTRREKRKTGERKERETVCHPVFHKGGCSPWVVEWTC